MINKLEENLRQAADALKGQLNGLSDTAKEKTNAVIEDWLKVFPKLREAGLEITSFGMELSLSPALEVELKGKRSDFTDEKIEKILADNAGDRTFASVVNTVKSVNGFYAKAGDLPSKPLLVKLNIGLPPRVQVFIGAPKIFN